MADVSDDILAVPPPPRVIGVINIGLPQNGGEVLVTVAGLAAQDEVIALGMLGSATRQLHARMGPKADAPRVVVPSIVTP